MNNTKIWFNHIVDGNIEDILNAEGAGANVNISFQVGIEACGRKVEVGNMPLSVREIMIPFLNTYAKDYQGKNVFSETGEVQACFNRCSFSGLDVAIIKNDLPMIIALLHTKRINQTFSSYLMDHLQSLGRDNSIIMLLNICGIKWQKSALNQTFEPTKLN
jgi:hypothetical protein